MTVREENWGVWRAKRGLVVALVGREGRPRRVIRSALTDDARFGLLEYLVAAGAELVVTDALSRVELLPGQAVCRGLVVWSVGDAFIGALLAAAGIRDPVRAAAMLGRFPAIPLLRGHLHLHSRQLSLLAPSR
ncbi:MAG TPA: hypothetical protein VMH26_08140 [Burkholderiales bacterium]|nr:hypothetical protein [Burkholderiales bacterium]